jgi:hypothetical protein
MAAASTLSHAGFAKMAVATWLRCDDTDGYKAHRASRL